jgi:hypothetical protein
MSHRFARCSSALFGGQGERLLASAPNRPARRGWFDAAGALDRPGLVAYVTAVAQHHRLAPGPISPYLSVERQKLVLPEPPKPDDDDNAWRELKRFPVIAGGEKVGRK